jgi:membrane dipeptidase
VKASGVTAVNVTVNSVGNGPNKFEETVAGIAYAEQQIADRPDYFMKVLAARDLTAAKTSGGMGLIYGFQDTSALDGDLRRLAMFQGLGVRIVQPVYNRRNLMGDGCLEPNDGGLSTLGRELLGEINKLKILVDLSHAGTRTQAEGIATSKAPVAITHSGCRALVDVPRNTHGRELKALADRGGISGIKLDEKYAEFQRKFFEERQKAGIAAPGEAADVFNLVPEYNDARRFVTLANDLSERGWSAKRIEKILGTNFVRLFGEVWG